VVASHPARLRVQDTSGRSVVIFAPAIEGDRISGLTAPRDHHPPPDSVHVMLADVTEIATRHVSAGRTAILIVGVVVTAGALTAAFQCHGESCIREQVPQ